MPRLNTTYVADNIDDAIAYVLTNNPACTALKLTSQYLEDPNVIRLCEALAQNTSIVLLDLENNFIGCEGAIALAQLTMMTSLNVSSNGIGKDGAVALAENTTLKLLNLGSNGLEPGDAMTLAGNDTLTSLDLSYNDLCEDDAFAFAKNATLTLLSLRGNSIGPEGAVELAYNDTLRSLDISYNRTGGDCAQHFSEENTTLMSLNVEGNEMRDAQLLIINQAIKNNSERPYVFACMKNTKQGLVTSMPIDMFQEITSFLVTDREELDNLRNFAEPRFFKPAIIAEASSGEEDEPAAKRQRVG